MGRRPPSRRRWSWQHDLERGRPAVARVDLVASRGTRSAVVTCGKAWVRRLATGLRNVLNPPQGCPDGRAPSRESSGVDAGPGNGVGCQDRYCNWPAAAVIPAPKAYVRVAAVKKLVVEFRGLSAAAASLRGGAFARPASPRRSGQAVRGVPSGGLPRACRRTSYLEEIRAFKAGVLAANALARDNGTRLRAEFVGWFF